MKDMKKKLEKTVEYLKGMIDGVPEIAVILGSGLGRLADFIEGKQEIPYGEIPNFPNTTVPGHEGKLIFGRLGDRNVVAMKGRFHYYEGHDMSTVVYPVRAFGLLGIKNLIVTNAAGGVNTGFEPGDLMLIRDHISFFAENPLRGENLDELGPRFPDMSAAYDRTLQKVAQACAERIGIDLKYGVYAYCKGPSFETPAEIRALRALGADAVGMSTVPEVIVARHMGMRVLGISCITNMAAGILDQPLTHEEVMETGKKVEQKFSSLVKEIVSQWP
ncbi:purine-nucleoside phosphorylase [Thermoclostridium caenicola]|uniref:Purine nucleoside phosphorylase n=1 Tax=Thermoclostridium caenicola TaxID=659425 RepID=A0A1M6FCI7_9FIRM|nr:purine-nucleoside phosphorylase [Thermoclostridium caenicola]SHI95329.1 purine-nucleoside phosphorylase [Thermoclostridium caenicola]